MAMLKVIIEATVGRVTGRVVHVAQAKG
jgi:hypothetical protein